MEGYQSVIEMVAKDFHDNITFVPDKESMHTLYIQGMLFGIVAEVGSQIAAAFIWSKAPSIAAADLMQAQEILWYVHKDFQGQGLMRPLLNYTSRQASYNGCKLLDLSLPPVSNKLITKKLKEYGFDAIETKYLKRL